ncbi:MAG TPA: hypothetical protein DF292_08075 [Firmicutes bacterium]|jgi:hypothetical protein|nr:hypothetical protein [Bacillota bacterium]HBL68836.1 hypothetical protein [Bacillota bacterium]HCT36969.1 hypothetical protein [Bacillota bacterium]
MAFPLVNRFIRLPQLVAAVKQKSVHSGKNLLYLVYLVRTAEPDSECLLRLTLPVRTGATLL